MCYRRMYTRDRGQIKTAFVSETLASYVQQINDNSVHAFINLLRARKVFFHRPVFEGIGEESWKVLGQALRGKTNIELRWVSILRRDLKEAIMEDIMTVWDIARDFGVVNVNTQDMGEVFVSKDNYDREQARARLQQISEMTFEEFRAECEKKDTGESTPC